MKILPIINTESMSTSDVLRTIAELEADPATLECYASMAAELVTHSYLKELYRVKAGISLNYRVRNFYAEDSGNYDVWIEFAALMSDGFITGGAYLTDIFQIGDLRKNQELKHYMFANIYKQA